jgi:hypothetical protein
MSQCKVSHNGTAYRFQDTESAQAFIDQLPTPRGHIEIEGGTTLFRLLNDVGAPMLNWKEINAEICNEWSQSFMGKQIELNWPLLSSKRVNLLTLFKSVMDIAEKSVSAEDAELIRNAREQQYKTFIVQEAMVGENVCVETLYAVTSREITSGRMDESNSLRQLAIDGISAPHLTRAELIAQMQPKAPLSFMQKIGNFLK